MEGSGFLRILNSQNKSIFRKEKKKVVIIYFWPIRERQMEAGLFFFFFFEEKFIATYETIFQNKQEEDLI